LQTIAKWETRVRAGIETKENPQNRISGKNTFLKFVDVFNLKIFL